MFKDNEIASSMALVSTKYNYLTNFDFSSHFKKVSETKIHDLPSHIMKVWVIVFISFNCISLDEQTDFWMLAVFLNISKIKAETKYFDLIFLSRTNA